jgi:hypothetical protein
MQTQPAVAAVPKRSERESDYSPVGGVEIGLNGVLPILFRMSACLGA